MLPNSLRPEDGEYSDLKVHSRENLKSRIISAFDTLSFHNLRISTHNVVSHSPIQWVPEALSLGVQRPGRDAEHSSPSSPKAMNAWSYPPLPQHASWRDVQLSIGMTLPFIGRHINELIKSH
jgi:hypothetical protein